MNSTKVETFLKMFHCFFFIALFSATKSWNSLHLTYFLYVQVIHHSMKLEDSTQDFTTFISWMRMKRMKKNTCDFMRIYLRALKRLATTFHEFFRLNCCLINYMRRKRWSSQVEGKISDFIETSTFYFALFFSYSLLVKITRKINF